MSVLSTPTFNQLATVLNSIVSQATGKAQITPVTTAEFVSVAQAGLATGYDPLMSAISTVLSKTIFSNRPYSAKFGGLKADAIRYGNHIRKLQLVDKDFEEDDRIKLQDGQSVDQYRVNKPQPLQTNFYGENVYQKSITIFKDQLDVAFSSPDEFNQFIGMVMQNASDVIEQAHEETARMTIANFIGGKTLADSANVIFLLDAYEAETGATGTTAANIRQPEKFVPFAKWLTAFIKTNARLMTERSIKYHQNFTINSKAYKISRHTPYSNMKCYLYSKTLDDIDSNVLSTVYNDEYLKMIDHETVNFWQAIDDPAKVSVKPGYTSAAGVATQASANVVLDNVLGVIFDEEAIGYTTINEWSAPTPFNARGGYSNIFYHFTDRFWNDFTENAIVMVLDHAPSK